MIRTVTVATVRANRTSGSRADRRARQASAATRRNQFAALAARHTRPQAGLLALVHGTPRPVKPSPVEPSPVEPASAAPVTHELTTSGGGEAWHGACSCGQWATARAMKRQASVKGAHTRHVNAG